MSEKPSVSGRLFAWVGGHTGCAALLGAFWGLVIGFGFGIGSAELRGYSRQYQEEKNQIEPILASDPALRELRCSMRSNGGINLSGLVPTEADRGGLRERVVRVVGEKRADEIVYGVQVRW